MKWAEVKAPVINRKALYWQALINGDVDYLDARDHGEQLRVKK